MTRGGGVGCCWDGCHSQHAHELLPQQEPTGPTYGLGCTTRVNQARVESVVYVIVVVRSNTAHETAYAQTKYLCLRECVRAYEHASSYL